MAVLIMEVNMPVPHFKQPDHFWLHAHVHIIFKRDQHSKQLVFEIDFHLCVRQLEDLHSFGVRRLESSTSTSSLNVTLVAARDGDFSEL